MFFLVGVPDGWLGRLKKWEIWPGLQSGCGARKEPDMGGEEKSIVMVAYLAGVCFLLLFCKPFVFAVFNGDCMAGWKGSDFLGWGLKYGMGSDARLVALCN